MAEWQQRAFGNTGFKVSALGFGAGEIGPAELAEDRVETILNQVLDLGITLIDTAHIYGMSEERIGRYLKSRRQQFVLSTKVGSALDGHPMWSGPAITAGIDLALKRLQTDYLDIVHLHSCTLEEMQDWAAIEALQAAVTAGKVRLAAYSGDNAAVEWAARSGQFASIQTSINLSDQRAIERVLPETQARGLGLIAKRPIANAPWRFTERPVGDYSEIYWERWQAMGIDPGPYEWQELAIRFTAYLPGVYSCIVGTANIEHLRQNLAYVEKGPLPAEMTEAIRQAFQQHDTDWVQKT